MYIRIKICSMYKLYNKTIGIYLIYIYIFNFHN